MSVETWNSLKTSASLSFNGRNLTLANWFWYQAFVLQFWPAKYRAKGDCHLSELSSWIGLPVTNLTRQFCLTEKAAHDQAGHP